MDEQRIREIVQDELASNRVGVAGTTPIGQVTKEFIDLMKRHRLTFREATLIFRDAREKMWPTIEERS
ncbi:hypothetical protein [Brevibacillus sp. SAFN-007a]|uniref:hypothetical protein n=1 Tax=Brevibacillus sp. SAFN-007a TaxID=3436862 RepID=UPI003F7D2F73